MTDVSMKVAKEQFVGVTYDELIAENAKLRELGKQYETMLADYRSKVAKLRELCTDMWFWGYEGHMDSKSQEWQMKHIDGVLDRMRELGVRV